MSQPSSIAVASFMLNVIMMKAMVVKGIATIDELKSEIDLSLLLLEESGLASGDEGRATHANLEMVLAIVSGVRPSTGT